MGFFIIYTFIASLTLIILFSVLNRFRKGRKTGKLPNILFLTGLALFVIMIAFVLYAVNHPEQSSPLPLSTTHAIYKIYGVVLVLILLIANGIKVIRKIKK